MSDDLRVLAITPRITSQCTIIYDVIIIFSTRQIIDVSAVRSRADRMDVASLSGNKAVTTFIFAVICNFVEISLKASLNVVLFTPDDVFEVV